MKPIFICNECSNTFSRQFTLNRHKHEKHNSLIITDAYKCDVCHLKCKTLSRLKQHKSVMHDTLFIFTCSSCCKTFKRHKNLVKHNLRHLNQRQFKCDHCSLDFNLKYDLKKHLELHERQMSYEHSCPMQEMGLQRYIIGDGFLPCTTRCKTIRDLDYHIQRNHTKDGIHCKLESENKLAHFLTTQHILFDRDWMNYLTFKECKNIEGGKVSARLDFYLPLESERLKCIVLIGNDEWQHRREQCDFQRVFNIIQSLEQSEHFSGLPILYIRFNPHFFAKGNKCYSIPLEESHKLLLKTITDIQPEDIKQGMNLVFINYDQTDDNTLKIFLNEENQETYCNLLSSCVLKII